MENLSSHELLILKMKITHEFKNALIELLPGEKKYNGLDHFIKQEHPDCKGFLLNKEPGDYGKRFYTVSLFATKGGYILINGEENSIEKKIKKFLALNSHAKFINVILGHTNDDFVQNRITAKLNFEFFPTS